jgi:hypothetical protein
VFVSVRGLRVGSAAVCSGSLVRLRHAAPEGRACPDRVSAYLCIDIDDLVSSGACDCLLGRKHVARLTDRLPASSSSASSHAVACRSASRYEKNPELTLALVGTGMAVGKAVGGVAVSGAAKALAAKMVAPFATKAATATLSGACVGGAAAGGAAAGPAGAAIGAVAGAAIGLGVDFGVQAGVSLMQRPAFEADVLTALDATAQDWEERLLLELERVEAVWFERAMATLAATAAPHRAAVAEEVS